jgi:peptidoglycan/xylan/chitin deacetylase (PgdA/CDA1 family)
MLRQTLARLAVRLDMDNVANRVMERISSRRFQILCFHKISPDPHPFFEPVPPKVFEQYVSFLSRCYRVMDLVELVERSQNGDVPERAVAVTFDDGYRDNYDYAFPILKKYGLTATIFVATGAIDTGETLWHDRVFDAFRFTEKTRAEVVPLGSLSLDPFLERRQSLQKTLAHAKTLHGAERELFVGAVENALIPGKRPSEESRMLTWDEIREMHQGGMRFGSHTVTHTIVTRLPSDTLLAELRSSRERLNEQLDAPISSFAYPNGQAADYDEASKNALKACGYSFAVTSRAGMNRAFADPFELRRGQPWQTQIELFRVNFFLQRHELIDVRN